MRSRTNSLRAKAVGAAQSNLSKSIILAEQIPVPSLEAQTRIEESCGAIRASGQSVSVLVTSLRTLRSELLTALLSGDDEIPESYDAVMELVDA